MVSLCDFEQSIDFSSSYFFSFNKEVIGVDDV